MTKDSPLFFHANGKLLLSGEYLVMKGAIALALPLKKGQSLCIQSQTEGFLHWEAGTLHGLWFNALFNRELKIVRSSDHTKANALKAILEAAINLNKNTMSKLEGRSVKTQLEFNPDWGWGSSSTLITNMAHWLNVNPYELLELTFGGSGYDIACANQPDPIFFQREEKHIAVNSCNFNPPFKNELYFVYSGKKQSSRKEISRFDQSLIYDEEIKSISEISKLMTSTKSLHEFGRLMEEHEKIIGNIVQSKPIKHEHFMDFRGYTKSLGAWGGDFFMAASSEKPEYIKSYFEKKGLNTCFTFDQIVLLNDIKQIKP